MNETFFKRGFLPARDPARGFPPDSPLAALDDLGHDLPSLLEDSGFREYMRHVAIPEWPEGELREDTLPYLRLYYVRIGFLASAYINQVGQPRTTTLPRNLAVPLCRTARALRRPPILSYDGYALYNWKRFDKEGPIGLGNIDTIQNFVHLYDEHWFILVHVAIEAMAGRMLAAMHRSAQWISDGNRDAVSEELRTIAAVLEAQVAVLRRLPEKMDPALYHRTFRPYIRFFENVVYEGVSEAPMNFRGETGAQSSIMPCLVGFMKIPHQPSALTNHLAEMRRFMPAEHRAVIDEVETMPAIREVAEPEAFNAVLDQMAAFRETHYKWAQEYINRWTDDPRGTGGTPYMAWLKQLIDETRAFRL